MERFTGNFTQQEPIPPEAIAAATRVMQSGRLHRYNTAPGEASEVSLLEQEFAEQTGAKYCLAVASGGYALGCALRAMGVGPGDKVLTNAFTLAPVPGAIAAVGARPVFVGVTRDLVIDLQDLEAKLDQADVLMLSHMRGHICDMDRLMALCDGAGVRVIEDCAHTMGAMWGDVPSGRHGAVGCYSTQTYKHINSGEGGLLVTDDADLAARAVILSGSYMLYDRHGAAPDPEVFEAIKLETPNVSGRMDNLRAAILRPQLAELPHQAERWNALYRVMEVGLCQTNGVYLPQRPEKEAFVASSFQFLLPGWSRGAVEQVISGCAGRGVELKWFGTPEPHGFTSRYSSWTYAAPEPLPETDKVLDGLLDMRLPLTFSPEDCALIARIITSEVRAAASS